MPTDLGHVHPIVVPAHRLCCVTHNLRQSLHAAGLHPWTQRASATTAILQSVTTGVRRSFTVARSRGAERGT